MKISGIYRSKNDFWKISYIGQYLISYIGQYTTISILTDICLHISFEKSNQGPNLELGDYTTLTQIECPTKNLDVTELKAMKIITEFQY